MLQNLPLTAQELYMREVRHIPHLTSDEEAALFAFLASGTNVQQARDRLVAGYQPLVIGMAKRFVRYCRGIEWIDLAQDGNVALLQALEKYDLSRGDSSFKTFAFIWIRTAMLNSVWQYQGVMRLPFHKLRAMRQMSIVNGRLLAELGREPTVAETAREMEMSEREIVELMALQEHQILRLHMILDDGETRLEDTIEDPAASAFTDNDFDSVEDVFEQLNEREQLVMRLRYGAIDGRTYTQKEVAHRLGITSSRVAVLEQQAKVRLRKALERHA